MNVQYLENIIGHLGAALRQQVASDDKIIMDHVREAYDSARKAMNDPAYCAVCGEYMPPHAPHMCPGRAACGNEALLTAIRPVIDPEREVSRDLTGAPTVHIELFVSELEALRALAPAISLPLLGKLNVDDPADPMNKRTLA